MLTFLNILFFFFFFPSSSFLHGFQWAMLVLNMERSISKGALAKYQQKYSSQIKIPWALAVKKGLVPASFGQADAEETGKDARHSLRLEGCVRD